ncbi:MAG TPA: porin [Aquabacterium sp.]|nr:porin [Aquabacterium sp.]HRH28282.1 porin [Aquabacterium sp.]
MTHSLRRRWMAAALVGLAGLGATSQVQAQTEVTTQGVLDFSYGRFEPSGLYRDYSFNSNSLTASFVGLTVKHGLDGGWTPGINLEAFVRFQDLRGGRRNDDPILSRNAFAFLQTPYGNVRVGRLQTFLFDTTNRFNALGNSVPFSPALKHLFNSGSLLGAQGDFYWNRAISYTSPSLEGFTVNVMQAQGETEPKGSLTGANVVWQYGLLAVAASGQRVYVNDGLEDPTDENVWQLGATYNFGVARVFGLHTQTQDRGLEVQSKLTSAGVSVPVGPGTILAQVGWGRAHGLAVSRRQQTLSAAYVYPYDSQTDLYVIGMDDRVRGQTPGGSLAVGVRWRFF